MSQRDKTIEELFRIAEKPLKKPIRNNNLDQMRDFVEMSAIMGGPNTIPVQILFYRYVEWCEFKEFMRFDQFLYTFAKLFPIQEEDSDNALFSLNIEFKEEEARRAFLFYQIQEGIDRSNDENIKEKNKKKPTKVSKSRSKI